MKLTDIELKLSDSYYTKEDLESQVYQRIQDKVRDILTNQPDLLNTTALGNYYLKTEIDGFLENKVNMDTFTQNISNLNGQNIKLGGTTENQNKTIAEMLAEKANKSTVDSLIDSVNSIDTKEHFQNGINFNEHWNTTNCWIMSRFNFIFINIDATLEIKHYDHIVSWYSLKPSGETIDTFEYSNSNSNDTGTITQQTDAWGNRVRTRVTENEYPLFGLGGWPKPIKNLSVHNIVKLSIPDIGETIGTIKINNNGNVSLWCDRTSIPSLSKIRGTIIYPYEGSITW